MRKKEGHCDVKLSVLIDTKMTIDKMD